jgi:hypothetical protein
MPLLPIGHDHWSACIHHSRLAGGSAQNVLVAATGATTSGEE